MLRLRPYAGEPDLADIVRIQNAEAEADGFPRRRVRRRARRGVQPPAATPSTRRRDVTIAELDGRPSPSPGASGWTRPTACASTGWTAPSTRRGDAWASARRSCATTSSACASWRLGQVTEKTRIFGSWSGDSQAGDDGAPARRRLRARALVLRDAPTDAGRHPRRRAARRAPAPTDHPRPRASRSGTPTSRRSEDHWGGFDHSDEHLERWLADPPTDLSLWVVAFDGDEIAGGIINVIDAAENEALGHPAAAG